MLVKWIPFLTSGVAKFSPISLSLAKDDTGYTVCTIRVKAVILAFSSLLWQCSMFLSHQRQLCRWQIMHHSCALQLWSIQPYSAQIFSAFDHGFFGLVWFGLGFLWVLFFLRVNVSTMWMHQTPCTYIPVEKEEISNLFKSFFLVNIRANITVLLLQCLKCFSFSEKRQ